MWQVTHFDITATPQPAERSLSAVAVLSARNVGKAAGTTFTFRINSKASVKSVAVGGATANFRTVAETRGNLQRITVTLPGSVAPDGTTNVSISYTLPVESNTGLAAISPQGSQFLPLSFWYPAVNTPFTVRGSDTAPFRLTVNGANAISSGVDKGGSGSSVYEQGLNAQPFFVQGEWDRIDGAGDVKDISALVPKGASAEERKQAESIMSLAASARAFYSALLGPAPATPIRIVAVRRGSGFNEAGTVLLEVGAFRRLKIDSATGLLTFRSSCAHVDWWLRRRFVAKAAVSFVMAWCDFWPPSLLKSSLVAKPLPPNSCDNDSPSPQLPKGMRHCLAQLLSMIRTLVPCPIEERWSGV